MMGGEKTATADFRGQCGLEQPLTRQDDVESQDRIEPQQSSASVWASETMSPLQEVLFVATVCLTQFCNRE